MRHIFFIRRLSNNITTRTGIKRPSYQKTTNSPGKWLMLGVPIITFGLGTWQVRRRSWKNEMIEKINQRTSADPLPLPQHTENIVWKELEYTKFSVTGVFDHPKELYVQPRTLVVAKDNAGGSLISTRSNVGVHVITPLYIPERGYSILINRGFVDKDHKNPSTRKAGQTENEVTITGVLRVTEINKMMPANRIEQNLWGFVDVEKMASVTGSQPILLDATADCTLQEGPIGGQTRIRLWNQHFSYIITWYSLSAFTTLMWYTKYIR